MLLLLLLPSAFCVVGRAEHDSLGRGNVTEVQSCCGSVFGGTCADGTQGTPCCGRGSCNLFCCACDGGCRLEMPAPAPGPAPSPLASKTPLNQWPMIMSHDAATSYFTGKTCEGVATAESDWVVTQSPGSWLSQLNCGARAFDLRLLSKNSRLISHHGAVDINVGVAHLLSEVKAWQVQNPNELVLVYGSHCSGEKCPEMFMEVLAAAGIPLLKCSEIEQLTLGSALEIGSILAVDGCVKENYDPSISCYKELASAAGAEAQLGAVPRQSQKGGSEDETSGKGVSVQKPNELVDSCHGSSSEKFFHALWASLAAVSDGRGKNQPFLWMAQAHWQYNAPSIVQGTVIGSCILKDESETGVNARLAEKITSGEFPHLNLLEVDNVCDGDGSGQKLLAALRGRFTMDLGMSEEAFAV